jgi:hypothetical protein
MRTTLDLNRPINDILASAYDDLGAMLDGLGAPAPLSAALVEYDLPAGLVRFRWENGATRRASAQLVGVAQPEPGGPPGARFMKWGFDEHGLSEAARAPALRLYALGKERDWEELTAPMVRMHIDRIWGFCGLAAALTGAGGAVMSHTQGREVYLTIGPLQAEG